LKPSFLLDEATQFKPARKRITPWILFKPVLSSEITNVAPGRGNGSLLAPNRIDSHHQLDVTWQPSLSLQNEQVTLSSTLPLVVQITVNLRPTRTYDSPWEETLHLALWTKLSMVQEIWGIRKLRTCGKAKRNSKGHISGT